MKPNEYKNLELDQIFKRRYLGNILWWKNFLLIAPSLLIFIGLAGILYIAQDGEIKTWYIAPYVAIFLMGIIWLKAIKKHLQDKLLKDKERFLVCAARSVGIEGGYHYFIFSKDSKRHNEILINQLAETTQLTEISHDQLNMAKKQMTEIQTREEETPIYLKAFSVNNVQKTNKENLGKGITPLLYVSPKNIFVIRRKDLPK